MVAQLGKAIAVTMSFMLASSFYAATVLYPLRSLCFFCARGAP